MKHQSLHTELPVPAETAQLDLVVPFTTPELTRAALKAAEQPGAGLHSAIRLLKVQVVPFRLQQSPVQPGFLKQQLEAFKSKLPLHACLLPAREYEPDLMRALRPESIVIMASKRRLRKPRQESLAATLRRAGHRVVLIHTTTEKDHPNNA